MIEIYGDMWKYYEEGCAVCIPINGFCQLDGKVVLGRDVGYQARRRFPGIDRLLNDHIRDNGWASVTLLLPGIFSFPVKRNYARKEDADVLEHYRLRFSGDEIIPGWALKAEISIIEESLGQLNQLRHSYSYPVIMLPRPGCEAGGLDWMDVYLSCAAYGDWLHVITLPEDDF